MDPRRFDVVAFAIHVGFKCALTHLCMKNLEGCVLVGWFLQPNIFNDELCELCYTLVNLSWTKHKTKKEKKKIQKLTLLPFPHICVCRQQPRWQCRQHPFTGAHPHHPPPRSSNSLYLTAAVMTFLRVAEGRDDMGARWPGDSSCKVSEANGSGMVGVLRTFSSLSS